MPVLFYAYLFHGGFLASQDAKIGKAPENPYKSRKHAVGIQLSSIAGMGVNYKYAVLDWLHARITGMIFPSKSGNVSYTYSNIGTDIQFTFFQTALGESVYFRNYVAAAVSYWEYNYSNGYISSRFHTGASLGVEFIISSRFLLHGDLGFGYYRYTRSESYDTTVAGGIGIGVMF